MNNDGLQGRNEGRRSAAGGKTEINGGHSADGGPREGEEQRRDEQRNHRYGIRGADLAFGKQADDAMMIWRGRIAVQRAVEKVACRSRRRGQQQHREQTRECRSHPLPQSADG